MASRVSKITAALYSTSGLTRVSKITASARVIPPAILRISSFKLTAYVQDELTPIRVSSLHANAWGSLDQGLYLSGDLFGSNEVFAPVSFTSTFQPVSPPVPDVEVNPYRADVPNVDQQRIMREQHNLAQAGDSTFHWGVLTEISATALYNLGSVGRFYHDEFGISIARYVKFTKMVETLAKAIPVGLNRKLNQPWVVTNQLELSDVKSAMGIACPYNPLVYSGSWYGWAIVDGFVPAELEVQQSNDSFEWATEYGWSETGKVKPGVAGVSLGTRFTTTKVPNLKPGEFLVKVNPLSQTVLNGWVTTKLAPLQTQLDTLTTQINSLAQTSGTHTQQIGQLQSQVVGLDNRIIRESEATARQFAAIRALMPDVDFKSYVDGQVAALTIKIDNQDSIIGQTANNALARVNELELKFEAQSTTALQEQVDALNDSMGELTNRLVGFITEIDTTVLTAGQVLVSTDAGLTPGGTQLYTFQPIDLKFASLSDVDVTTPPTDGQVPVWDGSASKWIPGDMTGGGGGGGSSTPWYFDPPLASSFTLLTSAGSNAALTDDPDVGLLIDPVNYDGTTKVMYRTLTDKTLDWSCVARFTGFMFAQNYASYGIHLQDSVGGRCLRNNMTNNVGIAATKMNSLTAYNSDYFTSDVSPGIPGALWLRMDRVGTNLHWMVSGDGKIWRTYNTQTVTDFLANAPDRVGLLVSSNARGLMVSCAHFSLTGPAV